MCSTRCSGGFASGNELFHVKHSRFCVAALHALRRADVRRSGHRRRPCRLRSRGCGGAARRARRAGHLPRRGRRPDVLQPVDRRRRQGPSGPRARRVRRADGARRRPRGDPPPDAQPQQGAGGVGPARPGGPQLYRAAVARTGRRERRRDRSSPRRCGSRSTAGASPGSRPARADSPAARWSSRPAPSSTRGCSSASRCIAGGRRGEQAAVAAWPARSARSAWRRAG